LLPSNPSVFINQSEPASHNIKATGRLAITSLRM
jgi:hypothetical protein